MKITFIFNISYKGIFAFSTDKKSSVGNGKSLKNAALL